MKVLQTVIVKQVLTENSRNKLLDQYVGRKRQLKKECEQLKFESKRLEKTRKFPPESLKRHFDHEIRIHMEKIKLLEFQIEQLHILSIGSELKEAELQGIVEVNEGDNWDEFLAGKTVVVKDGIVTEIRER
ncbi:YlqD family protein [Bacillus massilinigeriensis]|uniref:YlqD family protein n=1 Tax=Bacillus mediterraneensis TaxID=1805474 RepID=UPI0008F8B6E1|nr:YlqD family protein [Bacillus mediterraneensis]